MAIINATLQIFKRHAHDLGTGKHNFDTNTIAVKLLTVIPVVDAVDIGDTLLASNETVGSGYVSGGKPSTASWVYSISPNDRSVLDLADVTWVADANGPQDIVAAVITNVTSGRALGFADLRTGGQPLSLRSGDITISFNAAGVYDLAF